MLPARRRIFTGDFLIIVCVWALRLAFRKSSTSVELKNHIPRLAQPEEQVARLTRWVWQLEHDQQSAVPDPEPAEAFDIPATAPWFETTLAPHAHPHILLMAAIWAYTKFKR